MTSDNVSYFSYQLLKGMQCRAVARLFVTGVGGGALSSVPKARALWGGLGVSSPRKLSNLEATKRYFQHFSWDMSPKN